MEPSTPGVPGCAWRSRLTQTARAEPNNFCFIEACLLESNSSEGGRVGSWRTRSSRGSFLWPITFATSENKRQSPCFVIWMCRGLAVHSNVFLQLKSPLVPGILSPRRYLRLLIRSSLNLLPAKPGRGSSSSPGSGRCGMWPVLQPIALAADKTTTEHKPGSRANAVSD